MPTNFVIGQILMLLSHNEVKSKKGQLFTLPLIFMVAYAALIFVPVAGWYYYHYTAWSEVYLIPESQIAHWVGPSFFVQYVIGMFFGGLFAQSLIQLGRTWVVFVTLALGIVWLGATWAFTFDQYLHVGTFAEYHGGVAKNLIDDIDFQTKLNSGGAIMAVPVVGLAYWFFKRSRHIGRKWFR